MIRFEKFIEYNFYVLILLYFVGKLFKPVTFIIVIISIVYICKYFRDKKIQDFYLKFKGLIHIFTLFIIFLMIQSIFLELKILTFKSSLETIFYIMLFFSALLIFYNQEKKIIKLILVSYFILFIIGLDSIYQYIYNIDIFGKNAIIGEWGIRLTAWNDTHKVNVMMGQFFGLLLASVLIFKDKLKYLSIFMLIFCTVIFFLAGNRSPILALISSIVIILIFSSYKRILILFSMIFLFIFMLSFNDEKLSVGYKGLLNPTTNESTSGRYPIYLTALEMIKDNYILGIGSHNYKYYHNEYYKKVDFVKYEDYYDKNWEEITPTHVHSVWLDIILSYGILGTLILIMIFYNIYKFFIRNNSIGLIASVGFLYCITPLQFSKSFTQGDWQFITYLGLIFLALISNLNIGRKEFEKI